MPEPQDVTVSIFGGCSLLRSDADPSQLAELAADVDARMREAAAAGGDYIEGYAITPMYPLIDPSKPMVAEDQAAIDQDAAESSRSPLNVNCHGPDTCDTSKYTSPRCSAEGATSPPIE